MSLWRIAKDGLKALVLWVVASVVMVYLWGYTGRMLSLGLGLILVVSFCATRLAEIVTWLRAPGGGSNSGGKNIAG